MGASGARVEVSQDFEFRGAGGGVSSIPPAKRTCHPVFLRTWLRVTPGWSEATRNSLVSGSGRMVQRSVTIRTGPLVGMPSARRSRPVLPCPRVVTKVDGFDERARVLRHDDEDLVATDSDFGRTAAAGQPHLRSAVGANDGAVQITVAIHLRAPEKADGNSAALEPIAEDFRDRDGRERRLAQFAIADGKREDVGAGLDRTAFVDEGDAGSVAEARQVAGGRGQADADETDVAVRRARGRQPRSSFRRACSSWRCLERARADPGGEIPGRSASTFSPIQARNRSRSREISSHSM